MVVSSVSKIHTCVVVVSSVSYLTCVLVVVPVCLAVQWTIWNTSQFACIVFFIVMLRLMLITISARGWYILWGIALYMSFYYY